MQPTSNVDFDASSSGPSSDEAVMQDVVINPLEHKLKAQLCIVQHDAAEGADHVKLIFPMTGPQPYRANRPKLP